MPRSNIVAERAVKLMEDVRSSCKTDKYLNSKFINTNTQIWKTTKITTNAVATYATQFHVFLVCIVQETDMLW